MKPYYMRISSVAAVICAVMVKLITLSLTYECTRQILYINTLHQNVSKKRANFLDRYIGAYWYAVDSQRNVNIFFLLRKCNYATTSL